MGKNDLLKRIEKLEEDSHPPVSWKSKMENIIKRVDELTKLYGEIITNLMKQKGKGRK
jgi:hypothetical protein